jgi:hypothetical protein
MFAPRCLLAVVATAAMVVAASAADTTLPDGKYVLGYSATPATQSRLVIFELKTTDGKAEVKTVSGGAANWEVSGWAVKDGLLTADVKTARQAWAFEGKLDANGGRAVGTVGDATGRVIGRAVVAKTDLEELDAKNSVEPQTFTGTFKEYMDLRSAPAPLSVQMQQEKDEDKRKELLGKYRAAVAKFSAEGPALLRTVVDESSDDAVLYFAAPDLLRSPLAGKAKAEELKKWADKAMKAAAAHGPRAERAATLATAAALSGLDNAGGVALPFAEKAVALSEKAPAAQKVAMLKGLAVAQAAAGKADEAKKTQVTVDKLDADLDAEYKKDGPGFTADKYAGRKNKDANRAAVFEMFTGAMCPPCVAADLAFDVLETTYSPKDLILLQYHQHIPGPDPMTNPDTLARWKYYTEKFPQQVRGVPSSVFDGKPQAGGGGGKPNAKKKYDEYKEIIDATLEKTADVTVSGTAKLDAGAVKVDAAVKGKAENATVRLVLAEEEVRYQGGNGIRLHHMVVRGMFGKPDGWKVKDLTDGKATASVKLDELKKSLSDYMAKYHKETAKFSNPDRPLKFEHLKVIVLVQDDDTGEILNAAQFDVTK